MESPAPDIHLAEILTIDGSDVTLQRIQSNPSTRIPRVHCSYVAPLAASPKYNARYFLSKQSPQSPTFLSQSLIGSIPLL